MDVNLVPSPVKAMTLTIRLATAQGMATLMLRSAVITREFKIAVGLARLERRRVPTATDMTMASIVAVVTSNPDTMR